MSGRDIRVKIGALRVGHGFDAARFKRLLVERMTSPGDVDRAGARAAVDRAAKDATR